jgi:hypothetical protein
MLCRDNFSSKIHKCSQHFVFIDFKNKRRQAGAELCQAQVKLG